MESKPVQRLWLAALLIGPVVLFLLPAGFFDEGSIICPSRRFFNIECLGCGMTRAIMHLLHFDLDSALFYNRGSVLMLPALIFLWVKWATSAARFSGFLK